MAGREGAMLLDARFWLALCRTDHDFLHNNPKWAREMGYTFSRAALRREQQMEARLRASEHVPEKDEEPF